MSEGVERAAPAPRGHGFIRNPRDFWGGLALVALAVFALWAGSDLPGMRGFAFGPGTAPRMFAWSLLALGAAISLVGLLTDGPPSEQFGISGPLSGAVLVVACLTCAYFSARISKFLPFLPADVAYASVTAIVILGLAILLSYISPRGPLFVTAGVLIFAISVRPLGLIISSYVSILVCASATHEIRWIETVIWGAILTAFCAFLFPFALNLPLQLWPRF
jgi:hypothetical protein